MFWTILGAVSALAVECAEPVKPAVIDEAMQRTEDALRDLDEAGFNDGVNEVAGLLLPCSGQALSPQMSARYHRLMALHLQGLGDETGALLALKAAYTLQPTVSYPDDLVPPSHPLRASWTTLTTDPLTRTVPEPRFGSLAFDGTIGRERPRNRPTVAQVFDTSGVAVSTQYLGPREPMPTYEAIPRQRNLLLGCAGGAVAVSGITYGVAWGARSGVYRDAANPDTKAPALDKGRATGNAMAVVSGALFGVGAGCGVGAAVIGQR